MTHSQSPDYADASLWRGTTIIAVRKNGRLIVAVMDRSRSARP